MSAVRLAAAAAAASRPAIRASSLFRRAVSANAASAALPAARPATAATIAAMSTAPSPSPITPEQLAAQPNIQAALHAASHDFRSDVITAPTPAMAHAMLNASFGDDVYGEDAAVGALEARLAALTGKEAAMWAPSGTMANQVGLRAHLAAPPHSVVVDHRTHVYCYEGGMLSVLSQASPVPVAPANGVHLTVDEVEKAIIPESGHHSPPTRLVSLENTLSGTVLPLAHARAISDFVRAYPVPPGRAPIGMHLDGARLFDGVTAEGVSLAAYAACFDTVSLCMSKGLGAPMGSVLVGPAPLIARARWIRKMVGGGTRQPGPMAAAALVGLDTVPPRLPAVHARARLVADRLVALGYVLALPVQTNMVLLDLPASNGGRGVDGDAIVALCAQQGVKVAEGGRIVFTYQTADNAVDKLLAGFQRAIDQASS